MYGEARGVFGDDLFGLDIEGLDVVGLADFVGRGLAESALASDVGGDLDFWAVGEAVKAGIEGAGRCSELDMEGAGEEECA